MDFFLHPLKGFNTLPFGCSPAEFISVFGEPDEKEELDDPVFNDHANVFHYWDLGFSAFFTRGAQEMFTSIEIDAKNTELFGQKVFDLDEKELIELFKTNNYTLSESEKHDWGEKRLSFDEACVDLYFANGKLSSVNYGINTEDNSYRYFPN